MTPETTEKSLRFPFKINVATPLRIEAAKARLKLGEARLMDAGAGGLILSAIQDKDGIVLLDYDY